MVTNVVRQLEQKNVSGFYIGGTLDAQTPPPGPILQTRPWPVVPSPVNRLPSRSKASPFVPGIPVAKAAARGTAAHSGDVESSDGQPTECGVTLQTKPLMPPMVAASAT